MGSARLSGVVILFPVLLKVTFGQQFGFGNIQDCSSGTFGASSDQNTQRLYNLFSSSQGTNCNPKPLTGLQQFLNCQKPSNQQSNCSPCVSAQQSLNPLQQSQGQSNINQNDFYTLPLNLQRKILQQIQELQGASSQNNNVQAPEQSAYYQPSLGSLSMVNHVPGMTSGSLPTVNQVSGVPSQVSQSVLLSNLGVSSPLSSMVSNACSCPNQNTEQVVFGPQNAVASHSVSNNVVTPSSAPSPEGCFSTKFIPISAVPISKPTQNSYMVPVNQENTSTNQVQNLVLNTAFDKQNMPLQFMYQPVQQHVPVQNQQPAISSQSQPVVPQGVDPQAILASYVMSQLGYPNGAPYSQYLAEFAGYPSYQPAPIPNVATVATPNHGSKSSTVKALVPLLLNMLRDKGDCGYPNNNNCESFDENRNKELPQVHQGYANQFNYGQQQKTPETAYENASKNAVGSKEELSGKEKKTHQNSKHKTSEEVEDELDSYEEDDFEDDTIS